MTHLEKNLGANFNISESISNRLESDYLIISNKEKCRNILDKPEMSKEDDEF